MNSSLRKTLFMPAMVAKRHNPALKAFISRLKERGKTDMCIIGAIMRKLAHWIFAILKNNKPFDPSYAQSIS